jgi:hypothetical protein
MHCKKTLKRRHVRHIRHSVPRNSSSLLLIFFSFCRLCLDKSKKLESVSSIRLGLLRDSSQKSSGESTADKEVESLLRARCWSNLCII